jgi:pyridoxal phosphate enzyme (YggS family)
MDKTLFLSRYQSLQDRIATACAKSGRSPSDIRVIVVTKTHPVDTVQAVIDCGIRDIGENRVQEIEQKAPLVTGSFEMHLIGHLQSNKVNKVVPLVQWIQSIDSVRIAEKIGNTEAGLQKKIKALVQVKTADEATKSGCAPEECFALAEYVAKNPGLEFCGLMTIGPLDASESDTRKSFAALRMCAEKCRHLAPRIELSMGMSSDFEWAIEEGATMIRVGTMLLGQRE